jgi:hypothetical protein
MQPDKKSNEPFFEELIPIIAFIIIHVLCILVLIKNS